MKKSLVIVESPAKAKTISRFLGNQYKVVASYGHVRDLPGSAREIPKNVKDEPWARLAVDTSNDFKPVYVIPDRSKPRVKELKSELKNADELILATDEDREGESISWHLLEILKPKIPVKRIAFHEITRPAIEEALENPGEVNDLLVRSQESRRILDRLYGYSLSPVLWKKIRTKLSAGRVQSVAVRLVVDRERERMAFNKASYWDVVAHLKGSDGKSFTATLISVGNKKIPSGKDFDGKTGQPKDPDKVIVLDENQAQDVARKSEANLPWTVKNVEKKKQKKRPAPPFITSTLQQAAGSQLNFSPGRTMEIAQRLYEGVDLGGGDREGLITYMRTDSVTLSDKALSMAKQVILQDYGSDYYKGERRYKTRSKMAQEAHEAIRPTEISRRPSEMRRYLNKDELALYNLIWRRTVASQMAEAIVEKTTADIEAGIEGQSNTYRATGSIMVFPGFTKALGTSSEDTLLPQIEKGQQVISPKAASEKVEPKPLVFLKAEPTGHETSPPARYTEASLVRKLEEEGIGRPSTYAPTISVIQQRDYVQKKNGALAPTFLGIAVVDLLKEHFKDYVDLKFTAEMEEDLDEIAEGNRDWVQFLREFYYGEGKNDEGLIERIEKQLPEIDYPSIPLGKDPETGEPLVVRIGNRSAFVQRGEGGSENTITIPPDIAVDELTPGKASELLESKSKGRRELGQDETGQTIYALEGPFGPYVQLGEGEKGKKPKRVSLPKGMTVEDVDEKTAKKLLELPRTLGEHPETGKPVKAGIGRFGPFVQHERDFRSLKEDDNVLTVGLERALELLAQPKQRRGRAQKKVIRKIGEHPETGAELNIYEGRYGPYVSDGKLNGSIPKDTDPQNVTVDHAVEILEKAKERKQNKKKK